MRSIYAKILLWFWVAVVGAEATVMLVAVLSGHQPRVQLWMSLVTDTYGRGAVDIYLRDGKPALAQFVSGIEHSHRIRATLFDPQDRDVLGKGLPPEAVDLLREVRKAGQNRFRGGIVFTDADPVSTPQGTFVFVAQINAWEGFENPYLVGGFGFKLLIALLFTAVLCVVLARHIAAPIRALQAAAERIAGGDLSVRAMPTMGRRKDELANLARDFDRMADRIQMLLQKQQELLGDISHELRSPLARLNVSLELLRHGESAAIERMQIDLNRLDVLIGQVLSLTRLQVHEGQPLTTTLNLRSIVEGIAEDARFEGKKEEKSVVISQADDCWTTGDPALLRSCIENVVRNAVRHTKPHTGVIIALNRVDMTGETWAGVVVTDHGNGVPPESLSMLFEPFYRASESRDLGTSGFGLGLAIAQRVAVLHGGKITARNRDAAGLEIEIDLPLAEPDSARLSGNASDRVVPAIQEHE
jgi:two-component system, OmpR family, sensor histidine kinase CpxA